MCMCRTENDTLIDEKIYKINILYEFNAGAYGGANQFLKAMKKELKKTGRYTDDIVEADVIIFNSWNDAQKLIKIKKKYPRKIFVHRVDGPCKLYNNPHDRRDDIIYALNNAVADGTVFQSTYSREASIKMGISRNKYETVITNAVDSDIFYPKKKCVLDKTKKIKIIASSFSSNPKKGFDVYKYMDEKLDFDKYDMVFVGNSPITFQNIIQKPAMPSAELAKELRDSDIYITGSRKEACSNSLIEAQMCGLPAIVINDGSHLELIGKAGEAFNNLGEIFELLDKIIQNYEYYVSNINRQTIAEVADSYYKFCSRIIKDSENKKYYIKKLTIRKKIIVHYMLACYKITTKKDALIGKLKSKGIV